MDIDMTIKERVQITKLESSPALAASTEAQRNAALALIADRLYENREAIFAANREDCIQAEKDGVATPILKRLLFNEAKLDGVLAGIRDLIALPDPIGHPSLSRELDEGLTLYRVTCPIGVIGVIFESRPDALIQISTLCLKTGNCAILKGGSETMRSNKVLFDIIYQAAVDAGLPAGCLIQAEARSEISELLDCDDSVDLLIPRGSNAFVRYIMDNTLIPVMGHADGICHSYIDASADLAKAIRILVDAKTQYVAVCNATETLLVHEAVASNFLPELKKAFDEKQVTLRGNAAVQAIIPCEPMTEEEYKTEYLDYILSVKIVNDIDEAIRHINYYGSQHTDSIITEDRAAAEHFMQLVDSASCYMNCSTRFADGFRYGFGAEVGVSTGKLHARGPVGLEGLVTYKYKLFGDGHIVADYAEGRRSFHFKDL